MYYFKYILKRIGFGLIALIVVMFLSFVLIKSIEPGTVISEIQNIYEKELRIQMGYDKPILVQFWKYFVGIFTRWDWGFTFTSAFGEKLRPITQILGERLPPTVVFNLYTEIIAVPLGLLLGIVAAVKKGKRTDYIINIFVMLFVSVPFFVVAFLFQKWFCIGGLNWFPYKILTPPQTGTGWFSWPIFYSMILPIICVVVGSCAGLTRMVRAELSEQLSQEYMLLARTKGLTKSQSMWRHAFKNAMVPIFPALFASIIALMAGSILVEQIFGIPGTGQLILQAVTLKPNPDYNVFMGVQMFFVALSIANSILYDISICIIDPRIKMGAR